MRGRVGKLFCAFHEFSYLCCPESSKQPNERTHERTDEQTSAQTQELANKRTDERTNERTNERTSERIREQYWRNGRVVDGGSLENCCTAMYRGFESLFLRKKEWHRSASCGAFLMGGPLKACFHKARLVKKHRGPSGP